MDVELLTIPGCPHAEPARELLARALDLEGVDPGVVNVKVVESEEAAAVLDFPGSPTFRVGGRDIFESTAGPALSCRLYFTKSGFSGLPDLAPLRRAIRGTLRTSSPTALECCEASVHRISSPLRLLLSGRR